MSVKENVSGFVTMQELSTKKVEFPTYTMTAEEYNQMTSRIKELEDKVIFLDALKSAGVDNWQGYDDAWEIYEDMKSELE